MNKTFLICLSIFTSAVLLSACSGPSDDEYASVEKVCRFPVPSIGRPFYDDKDLASTYLTDDCKKALEAVIPFDEESFASAPIGMRLRILEAFQAILAYPLAFPKNGAIFGVTSKKMGMIPSVFYEIFEAEEDYNKSLFNYVLDRTESIIYEPGDLSTGTEAEYNIFERTITIYDYFVLENMSQFLNPLHHAAILIHEARHGDSFYHFLCPSPYDSRGLICDEEINGPYGLQATYLTTALHGSFTDTTYALPNTVVYLNSFEVCSVLKKRIKTLPTELAAFIASIEDCEKISVQNVLEWEGLQK